MTAIAKHIQELQEELKVNGATLVAVSKTRSNEDILEAYAAGQRLFGENHVQELVEKHENLPADIEWHLIGHLQTNKVKYIASFISLIHSVDSLKLLIEINKQAKKHDRVIDCLLQVYIAEEDTKYGLDYSELIELLRSTEFQQLEHVRIAGLMGMATHTANEKVIQEEFYEIATLFKGIKQSFFRGNEAFKILSTGMSSDYKIAVAQGSNMVRIGSTIFGDRNVSAKRTTST